MTTRTPVREFSFTAALDNYEPAPRDYAHGTAVVFAADEVRAETIVLRMASYFTDAHKAIFLIDDGKSVSAWYVSGWPGDADHDEVYLQPFPTNPDGRTRPDNGRVADFSSWMLGPRRAYHLKIQPTIKEEQGQ